MKVTRSRDEMEIIEPISHFTFTAEKDEHGEISGNGFVKGSPAQVRVQLLAALDVLAATFPEVRQK